MSHFVFKAKKPTGEIYSSERDAADRYELYRMIRESGDEVISFDERKDRAAFHMPFFGRNKGPKVKMIQKINFARNLGSMLEAGLPLSRALSVLERQSKKGLKAVLAGVIEEIDKGSTLADSLKHYPKIFPPLFTSMVHAGEQSGTLAQSLKVVGSQMDSTYTLERRIRGALMYPAVIVTAMIIIAILMLIFVIPILTKTFTELKVQLPASTRFILGTSDLIRYHGIWVLLVLIVLGFFYAWWSRQESGRKIIHRVLLNIPVIGPLVREVNTARTARTLSSLLSSGVDVVESVSITSTIVQNVHFRAILEKAKEAIKKGDLMSKVFDESGALYPPFFSEMMSVGEETGKMSEMLFGIAHYYEDDVEQKTKDMSTVIEPFLMIVIGTAVGFFAVSMISPMYSLVNAI